jgi:small conductance mechanosensitive channel
MKAKLITGIGLMLQFCASVFAADAPPKPQPTTTSDAVIALDELKLLLVPLTKDELIVEAEGWVGLVKGKAQQIAHGEIGVKSTAKGVAKAKADAEAFDGAKLVSHAVTPQGGEVVAGVETREQLLENLTKNRTERTALIDRARVVLAELERKGGKAGDHDTYLTAVSGINIDVKDTGAAWATVLGWTKSPEGGIRWAKNIGLFLGTLLVFKILSAIAGKATRAAIGVYKGTSELLRDFLVNSVRKVVMFVGLVVALSMLEVNIGPFLAAMGAFGFVVGFALQGTLSNFAAGVMILLYRPYDLGDTVTAGGANGKVASMSLVSTTITAPDNKTVIIPNSAIWGSAIQVHHA